MFPQKLGGKAALDLRRIQMVNDQMMTSLPARRQQDATESAEHVV